MLSFSRGGNMQRQDIALFQELLEGDVVHTEFLFQFHGPALVGGEDAHLETPRDSGCPPSDFPGSENAEGLTFERHAPEAAVVERTAFHAFFPFADVAQRGEKERENVFRDDVGTVVGHVADGDSLPPACIDIDVVVAHGARAEEFQVRELLDHRAREGRRNEGGNDLRILASLEKLLILQVCVGKRRMRKCFETSARSVCSTSRKRMLRGMFT